MFYLIGLGLDIDDLSEKAIRIISSCNEVYLECYTSSFPYSLKDLSTRLKKRLILCGREFIEEATTLIERAKEKDIALLIYGDPLIATTHISLIQEAKKKKIPFMVIHNISIINAITETGLEAYKFGKIASIPKWQENYKPTSFFDVIEDNLSIGAHTLLLLDINLSLKEAVSCILQTNTERESKLLNKKSLCIACSCLGTKHQKIIYTSLEKLSKLRLKKPISLIIPSKLHFIEEEFLKNFKYGQKKEWKKKK